MSKDVVIVCRNVFKSGKNTPAIGSFTKLWSDLIQQNENPPKPKQK